MSEVKQTTIRITEGTRQLLKLVQGRNKLNTYNSAIVYLMELYVEGLKNGTIEEID